MKNLLSQWNAAQDGTKSLDKDFLRAAAERQVEGLNREKGFLNLSDGYNCDKCSNRGFSYALNGLSIARQSCECAKPRATLRRMIESGLQDVIKKYTFASYIPEEPWQKEIKSAAEQYAKNPSERWFFIGGQSGSGKSHICTAICRELLRTYEVRYMLWEEESVYLKSVKMDSDVYQPRIQALYNAEVLYVDDFLGRKNGNREPTDADIDFAREFMNHRHLAHRTTIISSEWFSTEIFSLDQGLGGRIIENSPGFVFNIARDLENNQRLKKAST